MTGSGKTIFSAALINLLIKKGYKVSSGKVGPDYIDPTYVRSILNNNVFNFDTWAMNRGTIDYLMDESNQDMDINIIEGVMGLFDGTINGESSTAKFVSEYNIPTILIIDAKGQSQTLAAICKGLIEYNNNVKVVGLILNRISSQRHFLLIKQELDKINIKVLGYLPESSEFLFPRRHLGLHLAHQIKKYTQLLNNASQLVEEHINLHEILSLAKIHKKSRKSSIPESPIDMGQHIAIANDHAFSFVYDHWLHLWKKEGREISFFSPLKDEVPAKSCSGIFLPGGYPELYCEKLSENRNFRLGMLEARKKNKIIYGECGGYMILGKYIKDKIGKDHEMLGFLNLATSFFERKLHLGYRQVNRTDQCNYFGYQNILMAHEYHYSSTIQESGTPLFVSKDFDGRNNNFGLIEDKIFGSFLHIIDKKIV
tara:strand:- start:5605 stop:6882 length:1278 start_codon:yes stop_codon:yes gene_type:complete